MIPVTPGAYGDTDVINFTLAVDGGPSFSSSVFGGADFGRLAFSANPAVHRMIDNLVVSAIPEPTSISLLGLSSIVLMGLSRKQSR